MRLLTTFAVTLAGAGALSWVAVYNGSPILSVDTHAHYHAAQAATEAALSSLGKVTPFHRPVDRDRALSADTSARAPEISAGGESGTISTAKSAYYGFFVYLGDKIGGLPLVVLAQALVASWLLYVASRLLLPRHQLGGFVCVVAAAAALTSLPFFTSVLLPDVFSGLFILAIALLVATYHRLSRGERLAFFVLLTASCLFHQSHLLIGLLLLAVIGIFVLLPADQRPAGAVRAILFTAGAVAIGALGLLLFDFAVAKATGKPVVLPPILLARVIEDGPGTSYLRVSCAEKRYAVCEFVDRLPMTVDDFLWSRDPARGVWYAASAATRVRMAKEQFEVVWRSLRHAPLVQLKATARNVGRQFVDFGVTRFATSEEHKQFIQQFFVAAHADGFLRSRIARGSMPLAAFSVWQYLAVIASILVLVVRYRALGSVGKWVTQIVVWGIILNALATSAIWGPDGRFQARVIWLLPALAVIVVVGYRRRGDNQQVMEGA